MSSNRTLVFRSLPPRLVLGPDRPTPLVQAPDLAGQLGLAQLLIKRDDATHPRVGGNKVRKLEFILGDALEHGARNLVTVGGVGSNHAVATSYFGRLSGLRTTALLTPQPSNSSFAAYQEAHQLLGTTILRVSPSSALKIPATLARLASPATVLIPAGGSSSVGIMGYVLAAGELAEQLSSQALPPPNAIVVAAGSLGTAAGLAVGCGMHAALRDTRILAVATVPWPLANQTRLQRLVQRQVESLKRYVGFSVEPSPVSSVHGFVGRGYGHSTAAGRLATSYLASHATIQLDSVYTAKAGAALIAMARGRLMGRRVLFWNTKHHWPDIVGAARDAADSNALLEPAP